MSLGLLAFLHFAPLLTSFEKGLPPRDNFRVSSNSLWMLFGPRALLQFHADTESSALLLYKGRRGSCDEKILPLKCESWKAAGSAETQREGSQGLTTHRNWDVQDTERPRSQGSVSIRFGFQPGTKNDIFLCKPVCNPIGLT